MTFTEIVVLLIGLISWLIIFRVWYKHRKGLPLSRLETGALIISTVVTICSFVLQVIPILTNIQVIIPVSLGWWIPFVSTVILIIFLTIWIIRRSNTKVYEPNFDHIEYWFFYSKKFKHELGERDPKKHVPRQKLVLIKDLKKAYYVGKYALNLVLSDEIKS